MTRAAIAVPERFARTIAEAFGDAGRAWLIRLPDLLAGAAERWSLRLAAPFEPPSYSYVTGARRADGSAAVLKAAPPGPGARAEIEALRAFDGRGCARLLDTDESQGLLLLERLEPGTPLAALDDDERATGIAARLLRELPRPAPVAHPFPSVETWALGGLSRLRRRFQGGTGPFPAAVVERAERLFAELLASCPERLILHGDFHHGNVLAARRRPWLAIDPKGVVGERAFEAAALLRNPLPALLRMPDPARVLRCRVDRLAEEGGCERARIVAYGAAGNVLSAWWSYEDHGAGFEPALRCAELLGALVA